ncbi:MAG: hypothetical protein K5989_07450 [Lachnospiraceae bacterium]|nr:hypothetical protein [Lachnospiraceae bacterium]
MSSNREAAAILTFLPAEKDLQRFSLLPLPRIRLISGPFAAFADSGRSFPSDDIKGSRHLVSEPCDCGRSLLSDELKGSWHLAMESCDCNGFLSS